MAKYSKSKESISSEFLLWDVPHTETSIDSVEIMDFYPLTSLDTSSVVHFDIPGFNNMMLSDIYLMIKFNIKTDAGVVLTAKTNVAPVNNFAHVLWENVELKMNGYNVEQSMSQSFHLRSFFDTLLNTDVDRIDHLALTELFVLDTGTTKSENESTIFYDDSANSEVVVNHGGAARALRVAESKSVTLITKLKSNVFQEKCLPSDLPIQITLTRNKDGVCLIHPENKTYQINLEKVVLRGIFYKPKMEVLRAINERLTKDPALYLMPQGEINVYSVPKSVTSFVLNNFYRDKLPRLLIVAIQDRKAMQNHSHYNIYSFKPFKRLEIVINNEKYFPDTFETIAVSSKYHETALFLNQIYAACGYEHRGSCLLNAKNFQGHFLMALALTPDRSSHMLHLQRHKDVKLKIDLGYKAGDDEILIAYSIYDRFITIDGNRKVTAV